MRRRESFLRLREIVRPEREIAERHRDVEALGPRVSRMAQALPRLLGPALSLESLRQREVGLRVVAVLFDSRAKLFDRPDFVSLRRLDETQHVASIRCVLA